MFKDVPIDSNSSLTITYSKSTKSLENMDSSSSNMSRKESSATNDSYPKSKSRKSEKCVETSTQIPNCTSLSKNSVKGGTRYLKISPSSEKSNEVKKYYPASSLCKLIFFKR